MSPTAYQNLVQRLNLVRTKNTRNIVLFGIALSWAMALGLGWLLVILEASFYFSPTSKILLELLIVLGTLYLLIRYAIFPLLSPPSLETLALQLEKHFGGLQQQLISALQLWVEKDQPNQSKALIEAAIEHANQDTSHLNFDQIINRRRTQKAALVFVGIALFSFISHATWPIPLESATQRLLQPLTAFERPPDTYITLKPGHAEVVAGEPFEIIANLSGIVPRKAHLFTRENETQAWTPLTLPVRQKTAKHRFPAVTRSFSYYFAAHDNKTQPYTLTVRQRPLVTRVIHHDTFPPYTQLPERQNQEGGDIVVPIGTSVSLHIETNKPLDKAWLVFDENQHIPAQISKNHAQVKLNIDKDARYTIQLQDPHLIRNRDPVTYRIVALPDRAPDVRLLRPGNAELGETMQITVSAEAFDDYGITKMDVRYKINEQTQDQVKSMALAQRAKETTANTLWNLNALDLLPGDQIIYRVRAYDNNPSPNFGESQEFVIRFPSLYEIHEATEKAQTESLDEMANVQSQSQELTEKLETIARELLNDEKFDWQDKQQLEEALQTQENMNNQMQETAEKLAEALEKLEDSGLLKDDTLQKLEELQELIDQIQSPALQEAMEKLQEAMETTDTELVNKALEKFKNEREKFQESIDRTIALLKRVQQQQTLDALTKKLEALAEAQEAITEDTKNEISPEALAKRQEQITKDTEQLQDELQSSAENFSESAPTDNQLEQLAKEMEQKQLTQRMDQLQQNLESNQKSSEQSSEQSKKIAQDLEQMSQQMNQVRQQFSNKQKDDIAGELNRALHDLLTLSKSQERTVQRAETTQGREQTAPLALEQARTITGANRMLERLSEASKKTFFLPPQTGSALGDALQKMENAAGHLNSGNSQRAAQDARHAMQSLNSAAMMVQRALGKVASSQSGTGFEEMMQQMSQLSQQQGDVNAQTESLFGKPQPGPGQPGLEQLAAQQRAIQQALEQLRQELARQQQQMLGDLGKVASDMDQTAKELRQRQLTPETLKRQQQILSRMLDAQKSMRQRGKSRQREAERGKDVAYRGPGSLPTHLGEGDNPLRQYLRDALKEGYPTEYQSLIRNYFESLMKDAPTKSQSSPSQN
ncbi:MAG: DUF4175 family protein [Candidatus Latescibacteria bacterium]|jgi:hypothetical protein|nr:DUF4175 family protein [Candidatus Latescibacterota bacterium]